MFALYPFLSSQNDGTKYFTHSMAFMPMDEWKCDLCNVCLCAVPPWRRCRSSHTRTIAVDVIYEIWLRFLFGLCPVCSIFQMDVADLIRICCCLWDNISTAENTAITMIQMWSVQQLLRIFRVAILMARSHFIFRSQWMAVEKKTEDKVIQLGGCIIGFVINFNADILHKKNTNVGPVEHFQPVAGLASNRCIFQKI